MAESQTEIETETGSPIESGIEDEWDRYAYADDGEHAMVVGVRWADVDKSGDYWDGHRDSETVHYAVYVCEAGMAKQLKGTDTHVFYSRPNNLADAAKNILKELAEEDGRTPIEAAKDYWSDE